MTKRITNYMSNKQGRILAAVLGLIFVIFIGILVTAYIVARRANPILLDESGKPVNSQTVDQR